MTRYIYHIADDLVDRLNAEIARLGGPQQVRATAMLYGGEFASIMRGEGASQHFANLLAKHGVVLVAFDSRETVPESSSSTDTLKERLNFSVAFCARSLATQERHLYQATALAELADVLHGAPVAMPAEVARGFTSVSGYALGGLTVFVADPDTTILTQAVTVEITRLASHKAHYATEDE